MKTRFRSLLLVVIIHVVQSLNVLFVGNSFTYGPPPYDRPNQLQLNNLPRLFKLVAESLNQTVNIGEDTIGGCTLYQHRPSVTPEQFTNETAAENGFQLASSPRVNASEMCSFSAEIGPLKDQYHPCPQLLTRQPYGPWDVISLQDMSALPTVKAAREKMLRPAVGEFQSVLRRQGQRTGVKPIVASYMTWSYYNGSMVQCPGGTKDGCFPLGSLNALSDNCSDAYHEKVRQVPCQAYALARGSAETLEYGADLLIPAGVAWQAAIGSPAVPSHCKHAIDGEYINPGVLQQLDLPLRARKPSDARWTSAKSAQALYRDLGPSYDSPYCNNGCTIDHHPSVVGMYLNALVFYATLFKESPIGAAWPNGKIEVDGMVLPDIGNEDDARALQRIAHDIVLPHLNVWWNRPN